MDLKSNLFIISEIFFLANAYENLALHKQTWQQNPIPDADYSGSGRAVDDRYTTRKRFGGECVESEYGHQSATWHVDLGEVLSIHHIIIEYMDLGSPGHYIWNGFNPMTDRFLGFSVYISDTPNKENGFLCFRDTEYTRDTIPNPVNVTCNKYGRYVIYYNNRTHPPFPVGYHEYAFNDLCEVQVYGCPKLGYYGHDCSIPCPNNTCSKCHPETGSCDGYCQDGFHGRKCSLHCPDNCLFCHRKTGLCEECHPGFVGSYCLSMCDLGHYGLKCKHKCSPFCKTSGLCHHVTGECENGCMDGRQGSHCLDEVVKEYKRNEAEGEKTSSPLYMCLSSATLVTCLLLIGLLVFYIIRLKRNMKDNSETKIHHQVDNVEVSSQCTTQTETVV